MLHCVGWDKDADLNTLAGQTTGPLPYRQMGQYPPTSASLAESRVVERKKPSSSAANTSLFEHSGIGVKNREPSRFLSPVFDGFPP